jgi:hypothetical protein
MVLPGAYNGGPAPQQMPAPQNELPFPNQTELIPQPGLPYAPPSAAPGMSINGNANTGQPVKITPIK